MIFRLFLYILNDYFGTLRINNTVSCQLESILLLQTINQIFQFIFISIFSLFFFLTKIMKNLLNKKKGVSHFLRLEMFIVKCIFKGIIGCLLNHISMIFSTFEFGP